MREACGELTKNTEAECDVAEPNTNRLQPKWQKLTSNGVKAPETKATSTLQGFHFNIFSYVYFSAPY